MAFSTSYGGYSSATPYSSYPTQQGDANPQVPSQEQYAYYNWLSNQGLPPTPENLVAFQQSQSTPQGQPAGMSPGATPGGDQTANTPRDAGDWRHSADYGSWLERDHRLDDDTSRKAYAQELSENNGHRNWSTDGDYQKWVRDNKLTDSPDTQAQYDVSTRAQRESNYAKAGNGMPRVGDKRPEGDNRTAKEIIDQTPVLKELGNHHNLKDRLKQQVGDFETDPDAAFRAAKVLQYIKSSKKANGDDRKGEVTGSSTIEGFYGEGDAGVGTEAGLLDKFANNGYSALKSDHRLDEPDKAWVTSQGTFETSGEAAGRIFSLGLYHA
jgi:hypothetical protein